MRFWICCVAMAAQLLSMLGCGGGGTRAVTVTSLLDGDGSVEGSLTLRQAIEIVPAGGTIRFDPELDGGVIRLTSRATAHAMLRGEVFTFAAGHFTFEGFLPRDYGPSALHAEKSLTLDASGLPSGITLEWAGSPGADARILSVLGDLTCKNLIFRGGRSVAEPLSDGEQPHTLARGGAVAVWGHGRFEDCSFWDNRVQGDLDPSRDRGAFGGAIYGDRVTMDRGFVGGNVARGFGAAGGGIYSVGGVDGNEADGSRLTACSVSGNRVEGQHAYGGGIYSDGGGPGNGQAIELLNCTLACNLVTDNPEIEQNAMFQYYYRGGGIYMSNGRMDLRACTIAQNRVEGVAAVFNGEPNIAGGGVGATIGDAHVVEDMRLRHCAVVGNMVGEAGSLENQDVFTGSLIFFYSLGYNRIGRLDVNHMLVPVSEWNCLSRKFWPKEGDGEGFSAGEVLDLSSVRRHGTALSLGSDAGQEVVLWIPPGVEARDQLPAGPYELEYRYWQVVTKTGGTEEFLNLVLDEIRLAYPSELGPSFGSGLGDQTGVAFHGPGNTWPSNPENADWIAFWRNVDSEIGERLGDVRLGEAFWNRFAAGDLGANHSLETVLSIVPDLGPLALDQRGLPRGDGAGDVGAIEGD